ncbi:MAG TPA: putative dsRNA-binding protein, partial [Povalibacter sp.]
RLQELLQSRGLPLPGYLVESVSGEAHNQQFQVSCSVDVLGLKATGAGPSRRRAEQAAASAILLAITGHSVSPLVNTDAPGSPGSSGSDHP